ncbi:hypothetical protein [Paenibacillus sp. 2KB_22]|uniref:hypothetical protein n=1 Tax=Paenibacillus sp. 2KB_22 TaxID=3232978 RepID=UPI003F969C7C
MKRNVKKLSTMLLTSALMLSFAIPANAATETEPLSVVRESSVSSIVLTPSHDIQNKEDWNPTTELSTNNSENVYSTMALLPDQVRNLSNYNTDGKKASAQLATTVTAPYFETKATFVGNSQVRFLGTSPLYADELSIGETYQVKGLSISAGFPSGVGFSGANETVTYSKSYKHEWAINHSFNGITFTGAVIYSVNQSVNATASVGTNIYTAVAYDSSTI